MPSHGDPRRTDDGAYSLVQDDSVARGESGHGVVLLESSSLAHMSVPSAFERPSLVLLTRIERVIQESRVLNDLEQAAASDAARQAVAHTRRGLVRAVRVLRNPAAHSDMTFVALAVTGLEMVSLKKSCIFPVFGSCFQRAQDFFDRFLFCADLRCCGSFLPRHMTRRSWLRRGARNTTRPLMVTDRGTYTSSFWSRTSTPHSRLRDLGGEGAGGTCCCVGLVAAL